MLATPEFMPFNRITMSVCGGSLRTTIASVPFCALSQKRPQLLLVFWNPARSWLLHRCTLRWRKGMLMTHLFAGAPMKRHTQLSRPLGCGSSTGGDGLYHAAFFAACPDIRPRFDP